MPSITVSIDGEPALAWEGDELAITGLLARDFGRPTARPGNLCEQRGEALEDSRARNTDSAAAGGHDGRGDILDPLA